MSLFDLQDVKNNPHRSSFDLRSKRAFTAKCGELLPVYWTMCMPGDSFKIDQNWFSRTQPVQTSAYTRIREYFDFFYVPLRQLWKQAPQSLFSLQDNPVTASSSISSTSVGAVVPNCTLSELDAIFEATSSSPTFGESKNTLGYKRGDCAAKLLRYLGYGNFRKPGYVHNYGTSAPIEQFPQTYGQNVSVNLFPIAAYQKIYNDIFRNSQWEKTAPYTFNFDYWTGSGTLGTQILNQVLNVSTLGRTFFDLGYCNWNKDFITGVLPSQQLGDPASIYIAGGNITGRLRGNLTGHLSAGRPLPVTATSADSAGSAPRVYPADALEMGPNFNGISQLGGGTFNTSKPLEVFLPGSGQPVYYRLSDSVSDENSVSIDAAAQTSFSILAFRQAEALQKWKEIAMSGNRTYRDQVYRHFGVSLPSELSDTVHYIGGHSTNLQISEVINTALSGTDDEALIRGKGVGTGSGKGLSFKAKEYGIIMCIYHAMPLLDYQVSGQHPLLLHTNTEDFPVPEFDNLGYQPVPTVVLTNNPETQTDDKAQYLGYTARYWSWKGDLDRITGAFETTLRDWSAPFTDEYLKTFLAKKGGEFPLSYAFFKVDPAILNPIFLVNADGTWDTDTFLINSEFDIKVARNLSRTGLPY